VIAAQDQGDRRALMSCDQHVSARVWHLELGAELRDGACAGVATRVSAAPGGPALRRRQRAPARHWPQFIAGDTAMASSPDSASTWNSSDLLPPMAPGRLDDAKNQSHAIEHAPVAVRITA